MKWHYTLTTDDRMAHFHAMRPRWIARTFQNALPRQAGIWALLGLALWLAVSAEAMPAVLLFGVALVYMIQRDLRFPWTLRDSIARGFASTPPQEVTLEAVDDGLTEEILGVQSFAPWRCIDYYILLDGRLFLHLTSDQWAIVPEKALAAESARFEDLLQLLEFRQVPKRGQGFGAKSG